MASIPRPAVSTPADPAIVLSQRLPAQAVVDPRIDVCAQFALLRMRRADPAARAASNGLL
jgi:hypothetical protein